jgi:ABC-type polysaccharide/polyol phosphate transport system ATPase subunit
MNAVELRDIHKRFRIPHEKHTTLTERLLAAFRPVVYEQFEALRGVDLTIEQGSSVGIIGGNGSGKSTLLKIISGLLPPDRGTLVVNGTMSALLELGLGFNNELTVRENVELYAAVLGYPRREVHRRVDEAIGFAGLERFRDAKLKNLSTGMRARLGFATALQAESDILLLDEILAVGDADFSLKCLRVFEDLKRQRRTMVLVTHDLRQVQHFCDEAVWLQEGRIAAVGDPDTVIRAYLDTVGRTDEPSGTASQHFMGRAMRIVGGWIENEAGQRVSRVRSGETATLVLCVEARETTAQPIFGFGLKGEDGTFVFSDNSEGLGVATGVYPAGAAVEVRTRFSAALRNGRYEVVGAIGDGAMTTFIDLVDALTSFVVYGSRSRVLAPSPPGAHNFTDFQAELRWHLVPEGAQQERVAAATGEQEGHAR